jgi:EAL domain-containing protein (putative c-di-GMP-specific phosphodiesterase class I)
LAEQSPIATELTQFVLEQAIEASQRLRQVGIEITISCNLTSRDLLDRDLAHRVAALLEQTGIPPSGLGLEVTESSLIIDIDTAIGNLITLRGLGCRTSVDDFGTGYASLQYLQRLPVDEVKIDRSFVDGVALRASDRAIVTSATRLIQDLGLQAVAEGIEDQETLDVIAAIGCDIVQGFHIGRPVPVPEFVALASGHAYGPANRAPSAPS